MECNGEQTPLNLLGRQAFCNWHLTFSNQTALIALIKKSYYQNERLSGNNGNSLNCLDCTQCTCIRKQCFASTVVCNVKLKFRQASSATTCYISTLKRFWLYSVDRSKNSVTLLCYYWITVSLLPIFNIGQYFTNVSGYQTYTEAKFIASVIPFLSSKS